VCGVRDIESGAAAVVEHSWFCFEAMGSMGNFGMSLDAAIMKYS
jgi:hypothetical protein